MTTIEELKHLRESEDNVEFKEAKHNYPFAGGNHNDPAKRRRCVLGYIVALANEGGGKLVLGMADLFPHEVVGTDFAEGKVGELEDEIYERLRIRVRTKEMYEDGKRVLVLFVPARPLGRLFKFEGVYLMRSGESLREMPEHEIFRVLSEQEPDFSAQICKGLTMEDLAPEALRLLKEQYAEKQANATFNTLTDEQVLSDLELLKEGKLNYAALILLGKREAIRRYLPQAGVIIEYRSADTISYTARQEFQESLLIEVDKIWEYLNQPLTNPLQHIPHGFYIYDVATFHEAVIREAILNAVTHRSYQIQSEVVIKQYPDKIIITNAGGFPAGVDISNLLTVSSTPRSKRLAEVLQKTGLVERSGQGVDKIFYYSIIEGKPLPDYKADYYSVSLTLKSDIDKSFLYFVREYCKDLNVFELLTLYNIKEDILHEVDMQIIRKLLKLNLIEEKEAGKYALVNYHSVKEAVSIEEVDPNWTILRSCFATSQVVTMGQLEAAFQGYLNREQLKYWIGKLVDEKRLLKIGKTKGVKYVLGKSE